MSEELKLSVMHFFNLFVSPNEHPNVGWVNLTSTTEEIYVHICAHQKLLVTKKTHKILEKKFSLCKWKNCIDK